MLLKTYEVELKRTSFITMQVTAMSEEHARDKAWDALGDYVDRDPGEASWNIAAIEKIGDAE